MEGELLEGHWPADIEKYWQHNYVSDETLHLAAELGHERCGEVDDGRCSSVHPNLGLRYNIFTWSEQVSDFIEEMIQSEVILSLGTDQGSAGWEWWERFSCDMLNIGWYRNDHKGLLVGSNPTHGRKMPNNDYIWVIGEWLNQLPDEFLSFKVICPWYGYPSNHPKSTVDTTNRLMTDWRVFFSFETLYITMLHLRLVQPASMMPLVTLVVAVIVLGWTGWQLEPNCPPLYRIPEYHNPHRRNPHIYRLYGLEFVRMTPSTSSLCCCWGSEILSVRSLAAWRDMGFSTSFCLACHKHRNTMLASERTCIIAHPTVSYYKP